MYLPTSQADSVDVHAGLVPIQLDLGPAEKGVPYSSAILTSHLPYYLLSDLL